MACASVLKALPNLDDLLQCPVCYEIPSSQIFQCNEGHHVCDRCKARLNLCPVCRSMFFGTRNYALEELIAHIKNVKSGSKSSESGSGGSESTMSAENSVESGAPAASVNSEQSETARAMQCKGLFRCVCCIGQSERLPISRLLNHLRYYHSSDLIEGRSEEGEYMQAWQMSTAPGRIVTAVRIADMGIFYLVLEISVETIYGWVVMAAAPWVASDFHYTITISGRDREAVFSDCVWSVRSCEGSLKKRSRCLVVSGEDVAALTASQIINSRLCIKRSPEGEILPSEPRAILRVANRGAGDRNTNEGQLGSELRVVTNVLNDINNMIRQQENIRERIDPAPSVRPNPSPVVNRAVPAPAVARAAPAVARAAPAPAVARAAPAPMVARAGPAPAVAGPAPAHPNRLQVIIDAVQYEQRRAAREDAQEARESARITQNANRSAQNNIDQGRPATAQNFIRLGTVQANNSQRPATSFAGSSQAVSGRVSPPQYGESSQSIQQSSTRANRRKRRQRR